jgi:hypothetical protein
MGMGRTAQRAHAQEESRMKRGFLSAHHQTNGEDRMAT